MSTKEEMLNVIKDLQDKISEMDMDDNDMITEESASSSEISNDRSEPVFCGNNMIQNIRGVIDCMLSDSDDPKLRELRVDIDRRFNEIAENYRRDIYKQRKRLYELGGYESDKQFAQDIIKEHLEDHALADGFNLTDPSDEILPQKQAIRDEIASKSPERNMFDADVEMYGVLGSNAGSRFGLPGEIVGMGLGSVFGAIAGLADAINLKWG